MKHFLYYHKKMLLLSFVFLVIQVDGREVITDKKAQKSDMDIHAGSPAILRQSHAISLPLARQDEESGMERVDQGRVERLELRLPSASAKPNAAAQRASRNEITQNDSAPKPFDLSEHAGNKRKIQEQTGSNIDPEEIRLVMGKGPGSKAFRDALHEARAQLKPFLKAERTDRTKQNRQTVRSVSKKLKAPPKKLSLAPLPAEDYQREAVSCALRDAEIRQLEEKIEQEQQPRIREQELLLMAGKLVGQDNWEAARDVYWQLQQESTDPAVLEAVRRNLEVVEQQLAVEAETDPLEKERLELQLAALHGDLGHARAAKRIHQRLLKSAKNASVRAKAGERLRTQPKASRPPVPLELKSPDTTESIMPPPVDALGKEAAQ